MTKFSLIAFALTLLLGSAEARAETTRLALVIGNNAAPRGETDLGALQYADDDAARFYQMSQRWGAQTRLLTVLDAETEARYPELPKQARPPTMANVRAVVKELGAIAAQAQQQGDEVAFYFVFAGHGSVDKGSAYLSLLDGRITQSVLYDEIVRFVPSSFTHLLIDACHASGIVGSRGMFDRATSAKAVDLSPDEVVGVGRLNHFPHVGVLLSSTVGQEAHEWSRIESGVFSHELLSGLSGAADINRDGLVEYSEVEAFVAAANSGIEVRQAKPRIIAHPPASNRHAPLASLTTQRQPAWLEGNPTDLGHFHVELENGERYLDANIASGIPIRIVVPANTPFYLRSKDKEARLEGSEGQVIDLDKVEMLPLSSKKRGILESSFNRDLFSTRFSESYYRGYVDRVGTTAVSFDQRALAYDIPKPPSKKPLAISLVSISAASLVTTGVLAGFAVKEKNAFEATNIQVQAEPHRQKFQRYRGAAIATGALSLATGIAGAIIWPKGKGHKFDASYDPATRRFEATATIRF